MAKRVAKDKSGANHPFIPELKEQLRKGEVDRREFLRTTTLLGLSAAAAYAMAAEVTGQPLVGKAEAQTGKGGTFKYAMQVQAMTAGPHREPSAGPSPARSAVRFAPPGSDGHESPRYAPLPGP